MMPIVFSIVGTIVAYFLVGVMVQRVERGVCHTLGKRDTTIALGVVFLGLYLLFLAGPLIRRIARSRASGPNGEFGADWFTLLGVVSALTVVVVYTLGIYGLVKLVGRAETGRRLYFWAVGVFLFAVWMFVVFGTRFW